MTRRKGFTLVELLVVIAIIALLISLLLPALGKAIRSGRSLKDSTQVKQIHTAMLSFASQNKGRFPTPGLINRLVDENTGTQQPNLGLEDNARNNTASFYAAMIAQDFVPTILLIGPTEANAVVVEDKNYDYDLYNPGADVYWDPGFVANIHQSPANGQCNTSYSHMAICGKRKKEKWKDVGAAGDPIVGNRGVGKLTAVTIVLPGENEYTKSPTLLLHDPKKVWGGNVCFNDSHVERLENFYSSLTTYEFEFDPPVKDHIYTAEFGGTTSLTNHPEADAFLCITQTASNTGNSISPRFDALLP